MADSQYQVIVQAVIDAAQLQKQLQQATTQKAVKIQIKAQLDQQSIDNQIQRWNNALDKMASRSPAAFASDKVKATVIEFQSLYDGFKNGSVSADTMRTKLDNIRTSLTQVSSEMRVVNNNGMGFSEMVGTAIKKLVIWAGATTLIYGSLRQIGEGIKYVADLNKEMTNIQMVNEMNSAQINSLAQQYNKLAKELGVTTLEVAKGSVEWIRQGKSIDETRMALETSTKLATLGAMEASDATTKLTSVMNAYNVSAKDSSKITDVLISLDQAFATSTFEISEAMQESSSMAKQAGVSYQELAEQITVISSTTRQSGDTIGNALN